MKKRRRVATTAHPEPEYPTLRGHLSDRRRFLAVAGASLAASAVAAACNRSLGGSGDTDAGVDPDAAPPQPDAEVIIGGVAPEPNYYTVRIPLSGELTAYLIDGGYATFYVTAATYSVESYQILQDAVNGGTSAADTCRTVLEEHTYDALNTSAGITGAESDLRDALDALCEAEHGLPATLEAVTLHISYLSPTIDIDGDMPMPSYP